MKMLDAMLHHNIRFIDYEAIRSHSSDGRCGRLAAPLTAAERASLCPRPGDRLVAFGRLAGIAGAPSEP